MNYSFAELIRKYKEGSLIDAEKKALLSMLQSEKYKEELEATVDADWNNTENISDPETLELIYQQILIAKDNPAPVRRLPQRTWWKFAAAAAIIGFLCTGVYLYLNHSDKTAIAKTQTSSQKADVAPGGNKAVLTLADGSAIILDSAANGSLAKDGNANIIKLNSGMLAYTSEAPVNTGKPEVQYNTLTTPKGGQYQVTLSDGTKVWLNAVSSLRYPTAFAGDIREVELTGEAYFEVAKNPSKPFHVKTETQDVEVLGTHFNINAYNDEGTINTTLLEGSVRVVNNQLSMLKLIPGQQAQLDDRGELKLVPDADVEAAVAWKDGMFRFDGLGIETIMRQIARWYDVDVVYEGDVKNRVLSGRISRMADVNELLNALAITGKAKFRIEGRKIFVTP